MSAQANAVLAQAIRRTTPGDGYPLSKLSPAEAAEFEALPRDPLAALRLRCIQRDLKQRDLVPYIGSRARASETMAGKRPLTKATIANLHTHLGIPLDHLLGIPKPVEAEPQP